MYNVKYKQKRLSENTCIYTRERKFGLVEKLEPLITLTYSLSKIDEAFEMFKTPGLVKGKILIDSEQ